MMRALLIVFVAGVAFAQTPPEACIVKKGEQSVASATFGDKTYHFRKADCRDAFLSDPERYSQLYDALAEMLATGETIEAPREASLVPS
jgi:YHS domain-containing protein